jgi:geranylgeranyl diphosphate synthase type I
LTQPIEHLSHELAPGGRLVVLPGGHTGVAAHLTDVDDLLASTMDALADQWADLAGDGAADVLGSADLPAMLRSLLGRGGKRIRPTMTYLGWAATGRDRRGVGRREIVTVSAALELLHVFALVHDDVMDESHSRRGVPPIHRQAHARHVDASAVGNPHVFGNNIAILAGDLALAEADGLISGLSPEIRRLWRHLVVELVVGQRQDLTGTAARRRELPFARSVATLKSGRYTVQRPLELGAAAAAAPDAARARLTRYGAEVGVAFALRDDILGLWGDPGRTGKPAGDDLISGKPTVLLALAADRIHHPSARNAFDRVGSTDFGPDDLALLLDELTANGTRATVERMIDAAVDAAMDALDDPTLDPDAVEELRSLAHAIAWREK